MWCDKLVQPPLNSPISVMPAGSVDEIIHIPLKEPYVIRFWFERDNRDVREMEKVFGKGTVGYGENPGVLVPINPGVIIPIKWEIQSIAGVPLISMTNETKKVSAYTGRYIEREIAHVSYSPGIYLEPGDYRFVAHVLKDIPEADEYKVRLVMELPRDGAATWQLKLIFWGQVFLPIVWLIDCILAAVCIKRLISRRRSAIT